MKDSVAIKSLGRSPKEMTVQVNLSKDHTTQSMAGRRLFQAEETARTKALRRRNPQWM